MHKKLLSVASYEQLKDFTSDALSMLKETNPSTYKDLETYLYREIYGNHFCDWMLDMATKGMINEDDTYGPHWTVDQTTSVAKQNGIAFEDFNEFDWNYVMNLMYSDYYGAVSNEVSTYTKMAKKFLMDKDAKDGKAFCYYMEITKR